MLRLAAPLAVIGALLVAGTAEARWSQPFWLLDPGEYSWNPTLRVNDQGDAIAAWNGPDRSIMVAERFAGAPFGAPHPIGTGYNPRIALNTAGEAVVLWGVGQGYDRRLQVAQRPVGETFGEPQDVPIDEGHEIAYGYTYEPALADNGDAVLIWYDELSDHTDIGDGAYYPVAPAASWRQEDGAFGPPQIIGPFAGHDYSPTLAIDPHGRATIAWSRYHDGNPGLRGTWVTNGTRAGGFGAPNRISRSPHCGRDVRMRENKAGDTLIGWYATRCSSDLGQVAAAYRPRGGTFGEPELLSPATEPPGEFGIAAYGAAVAIDEKGNSLVDWYDNRDTVRYRDVDTGEWAPARHINAPEAPGSAQLSGGSVAFDHTGRQVYLWHDSFGGYGPSPLMSTRRQLDGDAEPAEEISIPGTSNLDATMGFDRRGGGVVLWMSGEGPKDKSSYDVPHGLAVAFYEDALPSVSDIELVVAEAGSLPPQQGGPLYKRNYNAIAFKASERGRAKVTVRRSKHCKRKGKPKRLHCTFRDVGSGHVKVKRGRNTVQLLPAWLAKVKDARRAQIRVRIKDGIGQRGRPRVRTFKP
jgi:hypothetical protein